MDRNNYVRENLDSIKRLQQSSGDSRREHGNPAGVPPNKENGCEEATDNSPINGCRTGVGDRIWGSEYSHWKSVYALEKWEPPH